MVGSRREENKMKVWLSRSCVFVAGAGGGVTGTGPRSSGSYSVPRTNCASALLTFEKGKKTSATYNPAFN